MFLSIRPAPEEDLRDGGRPTRETAVNWGDSGVKELLRRAEGEVNWRFIDVTQTLISSEVQNAGSQLTCSACEVKANAEAASLRPYTGVQGTKRRKPRRRTLGSEG